MNWFLVLKLESKKGGGVDIHPYNSLRLSLDWTLEALQNIKKNHIG